MSKFEDQEILALIRDPNTLEQGYKVLMEQYQRRIYGVIRKMLIIHEDADDVTQNTFIKAFRYIKNFKGDSSLFTWLYRIATNESLTHLERKKKRFLIPIEDHHQKMQSYLDESPLIDGDEISIRLQKILLTLPAKQRLVFNLKYFEELSYDEIKEITGTSVGALKASYHHASKKIEAEIMAAD
ncbi:DNA-directed RNA polymerase sigma-70 factor [Echinicola pacifica]|uniref:RNA polymerase sigma factor n=1 Tax=Echinicola pacifica TaxID=346377 RepID=A0A918PKI5_9BACT|nr:RNA polymerase sigma factor [Echinicola pacifica]GGZ13995.1 DNA-directed RNA polymerase sigma-70 factor [Echinicola pacifica]